MLIIILGAVGSGVGLLLGGFRLYTAVVRDRARIRTKLATGAIQNVPGIRSDEWVWFIEVINHGRRSVTLSSFAGLEYPKPGIVKFGKRSRWVVFTNCVEQLPKTLGEGEKITFWVYEDALVKGLREEGGVPHRVLVKDNAGHSFRRRIERKYLRLLSKLLKGRPEAERQDEGSAFDAEDAAKEEVARRS